MKKCLITLFLTLVLFVSGCCHIQYNPKTQLFTYFRIGEQKIGLLEIEADGVKVTLEDQKASADELVKALAKLEPSTLQKILAILLTGV